MPGILKILKPFRSTWLGRAGVQYVYHCDKSRHGKRVVFTKFDDSPMVEVKAIRGDGRTASFKVYEQYEANAGTVDREIEANALANKHFV